MGCSSCGALYQSAPGDRGVCDECRRLLPSDPSWRSGSASPGAASPKPSPKPTSAPSPRPAPGQPVAAIAKRPAAAFSAQRPKFHRSRAFRPIAIGAACALAVAGAGAWLSTHQRSLADLQRAIRRHSPSDAWAAVRRHASETWIAIERHLPFDELRAKLSGSAASAASSRVRDAGASHATHHRAQPSSPTWKNWKKSKRHSKDDLSGAGNTP
jgi:hypothetical protein